MSLKKSGHVSWGFKRSAKAWSALCGRAFARGGISLGVASWAGWRLLPKSFGPWNTVYSCFRAWTASGLWAAVLEALSEYADHEFLMLDSTAVRVHAHGCGAQGGQLAQAVACSRSSLSTKIHMTADALGYPLGFVLTGANVSDFDQAKPLIRKYLKPNAYAIMDKGA